MKIEKKIDIPVKNGMIWNVRWGTCRKYFQTKEHEFLSLHVCRSDFTL